MPSRDDTAVPAEQAILAAVSQFGTSVADKLATHDGSNEDHLRGPFEQLLMSAGKAFGLPTILVGETRLPELGIRPDYGVEVAGARIGYVELKAPGLGVPRIGKNLNSRNRAQWTQLSLLPNVLYTDGQEWALYRSGILVGREATLTPSLRYARNRLKPHDNYFREILQSFLTWQPERPRTIEHLVRITASLCRLLRGEVLDLIELEEQGARTSNRFITLAHEWRSLLFPTLRNPEFADAYAQTVTFALLLARVEGIDFTDRSIDEIALLLGKKHSLMGKALGVLMDGRDEHESIVIDSLLRVVGAVHWEDFDQNTYRNLFQYFLQEYDPDLRKQSGSYYTPDEIVSFMVRFVDDALARHLGRRRGLREDDVIVVDPAMGTGSYLATAVDRVAATIVRTEGPGQVAPQLRQLSKRLIGFEKQVAPFAVAELRLHNLLKNGYGAEVPREEFRFLTDALDNPDAQELEFGSVYDQILRSRLEANKIKRSTPVMVVIGNPPYRERAKGSALWIESRGADFVTRPSLDAFRAYGNGKFEHGLSNLSVYFWRWGTWKVFDAHPQHPPGIIAMITTAAYLRGPGFAGMREYLRRTTDKGWIIDLSPEGYRPPVSTRVFPETKHELCIGIFLRQNTPRPDEPSDIQYMSLRGSRHAKFAALSGISPANGSWLPCPSGWQEPFVTPSVNDIWQSSPSLAQLMPWSTTGVNPNRTWVYGPSRQILLDRWLRLTKSRPDVRAELVKAAPHLRRLDARMTTPLPGYPRRDQSILEEDGACNEPAQVSFRSFDRQWLIPDARIIHRPSPILWEIASPRQIFATEQRAHSISDQPGITLSALIPDMDHYDGRGGRTIPLYRDRGATAPNVASGLLQHLSEHFATPICKHSRAGCVRA